MFLSQIFLDVRCLWQGFQDLLDVSIPTIQLQKNKPFFWCFYPRYFAMFVVCDKGPRHHLIQYPRFNTHNSITGQHRNRTTYSYETSSSLLFSGYAFSYIAEKAMWRSVSLIISHCIWNADSTKKLTPPELLIALLLLAGIKFWRWMNAAGCLKRNVHNVKKNRKTKVNELGNLWLKHSSIVRLSGSEIKSLGVCMIHFQV